ncbi:hypothetical protein [Cohnella algarum]|uniref:hypothetical protein n=1 Tax=Cohnella algarum TaxID=2044859 RepID=UPI0019672A42|nr:hypothetical protein [Cohnella algarum]MBN2983934.1 hypothetical protein [Cohnella algarum]
MNRVRMGQPSAAIQQSGVWYVGTKLAAAIVGASVSYDSSSKTVFFKSENALNKVKTSDSRMRSEGGASYIDVRLLAKWYSGLTFSAAGGVLKIGYKG